MTDIENIPLYYISFKKSDKIEDHYKTHGFNRIKHFEAVDGRKMSVKKLMKENIISIRTYNDLKFGRKEHSGMPSLGAIGCTLSHYELWNLCVKQNWPFIIICEQDNRFNNISRQDIKKIQKIINKPRGVFVSAKITKQDHRKHFFGTHCCILSQDACKVLIQNCFPIDVQVDWYIAHLGTRNKISLEGFPISSQLGNGTTIQDSCVICFLPKNSMVYLIFIIALVVLLVVVFIIKNKYKDCQNNLGVCS